MVTITLPLPHRILSPNGRTHWAGKARAVKTYRTQAHLAARERLPRSWAGTEFARITCRFYFPDRRRRDRDNLLASMKAAFDGIADSGLIRDDCGVVHMPVIVDYDRGRPRVEITVVPVDPRG